VRAQTLIFGHPSAARKGNKMIAGAAPRLRLFLATGLLLALLAMLAWTPTPASAATDSISAVVQVCALPSGPSCDPTQPLNGSDWTTSTTVYGSEVWWRVVVTNTGTEALSSINVTISLPHTGLPNGTDCFGSVPVPGNSLAAGASYGYMCQTNPVTPVPSTVVQTVSASGTGASGTASSPTSPAATAIVQPDIPPAGASISAVLQICTMPTDSQCDPSASTPLTDPSWASSTETLYSIPPSTQVARWRVFITNSGTLPLTTFDATDTLPQTDCAGSVPAVLPGFNGTLAPGASYAYECQTNLVTTTTTNAVTVTAFPSPYPTGGAPVTSAPSSATSMGIPTSLATTSDTTSSVGLNWSAASAGTTGFSVYRNGTQVGTTVTNSYTDTTVTPSTTYQYTVDAFNQWGVHSAQSTALPVTTLATPHGYWLVGSDGGIFSFGSAGFHGSMGGIRLQRPVVGIAPTADWGGYWLDASDGGVFSFGDTQFYGSIPGLGLHPAGSGLPHSLNAPIVGMVPSHDQGGYLMVASDGGVFAFGDARFAGSCPGIGGCAGAAVAVMSDASGNGYWLITSTGNMYAFGDAHYFGAPGHGMVTSAVATPDGNGYWILLSDGEVFPYGDAASFGSPSSSNFNNANPATAIFSTSDGAGYWVASALGAVFNYGDAPNDGGMAGTDLNGTIEAASGS
jgi:hypothetical protein